VDVSVDPLPETDGGVTFSGGEAAMGPVASEAAVDGGGSTLLAAVTTERMRLPMSAEVNRYELAVRPGTKTHVTTAASHRSQP
jgi:hypothetical protein